MTSQILRPHATRRRYVPDLNLLLDRCEHNYFTLKALFARVLDTKPCAVGLALSVLEQDRYTTTLQLEEMRTASHFVDKGPQFIVRLYHDVKLAEVLQLHNRRILKGSYPYPNTAMLQRDEKQRVNEFLAEWLGTVETRRLTVFHKVPDLIVDHSQWKSLP
jgi:hypothetical protein